VEAVVLLVGEQDGPVVGGEAEAATVVAEGELVAVVDF
jgi:hypothetical protein